MKSPDTAVQLDNHILPISFMTAYSVSIFQCKKSQILVTLGNAQNITIDSAIWKVKLHITEFSEATEYMTLNRYASEYLKCFKIHTYLQQTKETLIG